MHSKRAARSFVRGLEIRLKNTDSTFQKIQQLSLSSLYAVLQVCNNLSSKQNIEDSVRMLTHSIVLSLAANRELNLKRRDLLRSDLNKHYAALCDPSTPVSKYLFGDDLNKEMEDLSKASKLTKKITPSPRMQPYRGPVGRASTYVPSRSNDDDKLYLKNHTLASSTFADFDEGRVNYIINSSKNRKNKPIKNEHIYNSQPNIIP